MDGGESGLLAELRCGDAPRAAAAAAEIGRAFSDSPARARALQSLGALPALIQLLSAPPPRGEACCAAARALERLACAHPASASPSAGPLTALLRGSPGPRPDAAAAAAAAALAALLPRDAAARAAAVQAGAASALPALLCAPDVPTRNAAAEALRELVADCGGAREQLRDTGGLVALCSTLGGRDGVGLDCALGQSIALTLLRCAHSEPLRPALGEAGRACWVLLETRGGEWTAGPPARPAARLAALLLVALLYCSPRDGNRAAGKFCNRLGLAQAVAAMLDAAAAGTAGGSFEFLGARWRAHEPIAYCRLLAENEDFSGKLSGLGTQARLGALMASGALLSAGGAQPPLLDWMGAAVHIAGADAAGELGRVGSAWEGAVAGAVAALGGALCCAAPLAADGGEEEGRGAAVPAH